MRLRKIKWSCPKPRKRTQRSHTLAAARIAARKAKEAPPDQSVEVMASAAKTEQEARPAAPPASVRAVAKAM